jgi:tRNA dimethylallyltransferase
MNQPTAERKAAHTDRNVSNGEPLLVVAGPTGSGKSALAIHLAAKFDGEVVNCDSLQIYRGLDIGTAKTPPQDRRGVPHHLFDVLSLKEGYSAGEYARVARQVIAGISARGRLPVVAGGTGFYLRALLEGLPKLPARHPALRERLAARERKWPGSLHRILSRLDPAAADRIHSHDTQKLIRAVEICLLTRKPLPSREHAAPLEGYSVLKLGLDPDREFLRQRLEARTRAMFASGLIEEVRGLLAAGATGDEKPFESLGYKQTIAHLKGEITLEEATESTIIETRQYAKRQRTWFRRDAGIHWIYGFGDAPAVQAAAEECVRKWLEEINSGAQSARADTG